MLFFCLERENNDTVISKSVEHDIIAAFSRHSCKVIEYLSAKYWFLSLSAFTL